MILKIWLTIVFLIISVLLSAMTIKDIHEYEEWFGLLIMAILYLLPLFFILTIVLIWSCNL